MEELLLRLFVVGIIFVLIVYTGIGITTAKVSLKYLCDWNYDQLFELLNENKPLRYLFYVAVTICWPVVEFMDSIVLYKSINNRVAQKNNKSGNIKTSDTNSSIKGRAN